MAALSVILWTFVLGFFGILAVSIRQLTYWRFKGIPCMDSVPLIGFFFPVFIRKKSILEVIEICYKSCPGAKYFGCLDFGSPLLVIKDPEIVKDIGVKNFGNFTNHREFVSEEFDPILSKNVFSLKDDRWRSMRMVLTPAFTANKMKYMYELVSECSADFVQYLIEHPELTKEMDLKDVYTRYTNDVIATTAFGISVNSLKDRNNEFYINGKDATTFEGFWKFMKFLAARAFPKFMRSIGVSFLSARADTFFKTLITDTVKTRDENGIVRPDMIHLLMQARNNEKGIEMTTDDIIAQAIVFFLAGFDTTARLMCFTSHVLSHHPEVQDRLRDEIDTIFEEEQGNITFEMLGRMKYIDMVLAETLRLYPPQPFIDRVCTKPYELPSSMEGYKPFIVDRDMTLLIPIFGYHRNPNYFPEPEKFDPERFSDENKDKIQPYTYMPFGIGQRRCIGDRFALMETKIIIARLMRNFIFKPSKKTTKTIVFAKDGSLTGPVNGFWMKLEQRKMQ